MFGGVAAALLFAVGTAKRTQTNVLNRDDQPAERSSLTPCPCTIWRHCSSWDILPGGGQNGVACVASPDAVVSMGHMVQCVPQRHGGLNYYCPPILPHKCDPEKECIETELTTCSDDTCEQPAWMPKERTAPFCAMTECTHAECCERGIVPVTEAPPPANLEALPCPERINALAEPTLERLTAYVDDCGFNAGDVNYGAGDFQLTTGGQQKLWDDQCQSVNVLQHSPENVFAEAQALQEACPHPRLSAQMSPVGIFATTAALDRVWSEAPGRERLAVPTPAPVVLPPVPIQVLPPAPPAHDVSDDWMDWECPGFPCFVVNYFDVQAKDDFRQACTPLSTMSQCRLLITGENFPAKLADGGIAGWHNSTKGHPCTASYGCDQAGGCLQGSRGKCYALCDQLNLVAPYDKRCTDTCQMYCPEETDDIACSQCEAHGYGADQCECGQCGSFGGCGWTCGKDASRQPLGPKCIRLPPAPSPTPVVPPSPPPPPGPPPPNPDLPAGGCCSWAGEGEMDECGDSTPWCKANAGNCKACDGHWACPNGPCPAPAPSPSDIPARGCCSWAKAGQTEQCGESTSWCKSSIRNCQECQGHWVYPEADLDCSECTSHGYGADKCGCGYCGSYGGCGWTCGHDSSQSPPGPKCKVGTFEV